MRKHQFRRFRWITEDENQKERLLQLLDDKNLSREDIMLILLSICISPEIYKERVLALL